MGAAQGGDELASLKELLLRKPDEQAPTNPSPEITQGLIGMGSRTLAAEWNLARAPIWYPVQHGPRGRGRSDNLMLWKRPYSQVSSEQAPDYRDLMLCIYLMTEYALAGCRPDRVVLVSVKAAAEAMGFSLIGGTQRRTVKRSLRRLRAVAIESAIRGWRTAKFVYGWGPIDAYLIIGDRVAVRLSQEIAGGIVAGCVSFCHRPTLLSLAARDLVAMRLWVFLEAERLDHRWRYRMFGMGNGDLDDHSFPPIVALLRLGDHKRSRCLARIRSALAVIRACDPRYDVGLEESADGDDWILHVRKSQQPADPTDRAQVPGPMAPALGANGALSSGPMTPRTGANGARPRVQIEGYRRLPVVSSVSSSVVPGREDKRLRPVGELLSKLVGAGLGPELAAEYGARFATTGTGAPPVARDCSEAGSSEEEPP